MVRIVAVGVTGAGLVLVVGVGALGRGETVGTRLPWRVSGVAAGVVVAMLVLLHAGAVRARRGDRPTGCMGRVREK
jgi:hypothetical protein